MTPTWKLRHYYREQINVELERMMNQRDTTKLGDRNEILRHYTKLIAKVRPRGRRNLVLKIEGCI